MHVQIRSCRPFTARSRLVVRAKEGFEDKAAPQQGRLDSSGYIKWVAGPAKDTHSDTKPGLSARHLTATTTACPLPCATELWHAVCCRDNSGKGNMYPELSKPYLKSGRAEQVATEGVLGGSTGGAHAATASVVHTCNLMYAEL